MLRRKYGPRQTESNRTLEKFAKKEGGRGVSLLAEQLPVSQE
jgi:hypothetical protein